MDITNPTLDTPTDVRAWFDALLAAGVNFHPEESFGEMVDAEGAPSFTDVEAARMDAAMDRAYVLTGDACEVAVEAFEARS